MTIVLPLHSRDKDLEEIEQIVISMEVVNLTRRIISQTQDLVIMSKKRQSGKKQGL